MKENKADFKTIWIKKEYHRKLKILASVRAVPLNKLVGEIISEYCTKNSNTENNELTN
jgi:predicted DNA-binding ribbon-helix-helix protein